MASPNHRTAAKARSTHSYTSHEERHLPYYGRASRKKSATDMYNCTHGPKKDCHACIVAELVAALQQLGKAILSEVNADPNLFLGREMDEALQQVHVVLERAQLMEDCIPSDEAEEASRT